MNIFVGNLAREVSEEDIRTEFAAFGGVTSVTIIKDKFSGQPRGFAFVEMPDKTEAETAVSSLKGKSLKDRTMDISEAQPRTENRGGGGRFSGKRKPQRRR